MIQSKTRNSQSERRNAIVVALQAAERVLPFFQKGHPDDSRPSNAIEAGHDWLECRISVQATRQTAFCAHAAARMATRPSAVAAARSAGHAAATAHVVGHAAAALKYADLAERLEATAVENEE